MVPIRRVFNYSHRRHTVVDFQQEIENNERQVYVNNLDRQVSCIAQIMTPIQTDQTRRILTLQ